MFLELLRQTPDLDWSYLSPSAMFIPGERTGKFRLGGDQLLSNDQGSSISFEDYAIAMADERNSRPRGVGDIRTPAALKYGTDNSAIRFESAILR